MAHQTAARLQLEVSDLQRRCPPVAASAVGTPSVDAVPAATAVAQLVAPQPAQVIAEAFDVQRASSAFAAAQQPAATATQPAAQPAAAQAAAQPVQDAAPAVGLPAAALPAQLLVAATAQTAAQPATQLVPGAAAQPIAAAAAPIDLVKPSSAAVSTGVVTGTAPLSALHAEHR